MDEALKQQAQEWFERGDQDIETAQLLYREKGHTGAICLHREPHKLKKGGEG